jgi:tetratricopeptide (TPR) repeat protein
VAGFVYWGLAQCCDLLRLRAWRSCQRPLGEITRAIASNNKIHELRIKGCTAIIQVNPKDAIAYHNRGEAYSLKGEVDRAISDYNKAIELNPNFAPAYNSRGRAFTSKGDYVHAVADVTKARELIPQQGALPVTVEAIPPKPNGSAKPRLVAPSKGPVAEYSVGGSWPAWARSTLGR